MLSVLHTDIILQ